MVANEAENDMNNPNDTNDTSVIAEAMLPNLLVRRRQNAYSEDVHEYKDRQEAQCG
jgi:hypothetical protein